MEKKPGNVFRIVSFVHKITLELSDIVAVSE